MYMAVGLDTGELISKVEVAFEDRDTTGSLVDKLSAAGAQLLQDTLPDLLAGRIKAIPQNDEAAIYSPNVSREQELIDWSRPAVVIWNQVRGLNPRPGAYTIWDGEVLKIWTCAKPEAQDNPSDISDEKAYTKVPGTIVSLSEAGIQVAAGEGVLTITELQPAGKKAMNAAQFVRGGRLTVGTVLG
jgi:methionyl-tRNA formyltransferase